MGSATVSRFGRFYGQVRVATNDDVSRVLLPIGIPQQKRVRLQ
jgi:hypothetical protein